MFKLYKWSIKDFPTHICRYEHTITIIDDDFVSEKIIKKSFTYHEEIIVAETIIEYYETNRLPVVENLILFILYLKTRGLVSRR